MLSRLRSRICEPAMARPKASWSPVGVGRRSRLGERKRATDTQPGASANVPEHSGGLCQRLRTRAMQRCRLQLSPIVGAVHTAGPIRGTAAILSGLNRYSDAKVHTQAGKEPLNSFRLKVAPQVVNGRAQAAPDRNRRGTLTRMAQAAARAERHAGSRRSAEPCVASGRHWICQCCARVTSGNRFAGNPGSCALKRAWYA